MSSSKGRILIVEDDRSIALGLAMNLRSEGFEVGTAEDGESALERIQAENWDLIILDIMLPRLNGYEVLCAMRSEHSRVPVLVLSARTAELDRVMGLDLGADDYVTKPFSVAELMARVRALMRRRERDEDAGWQFGSVEIDPGTREVLRDGRPVRLTATEFEVLAALARAGGRVLSRNQIIEGVWGPGHHATARTIDNFIAQLRAKLEEKPKRPQHLLTVRGAGYRLTR